MSSSISYLSSVHYLLEAPEDVSLQSATFLLYFNNIDIAKLDIAISEIKLRKAFNQKVGCFYDHYSILCLPEFDRILNRNISITKCKVDFIFPGKNNNLYCLTTVADLICVYNFLEDDIETRMISRLLIINPKLSELWGVRIGGDTLRAICWLSNSKYIKTIDFEESTDLTDDTLKLLSYSCPNLIHIRLLDTYATSDTQLTDNSIQCITNNCINLQYLSIDYTNITNISMNYLSNLSSLISLELNMTDNITPEGKLVYSNGII